jgi:1,4-dihydroxy-2-naphthoate polyprenyltransferase
MPVSVTTPRASLRPWLMASRPRTLPASLSPVIVGTALALRGAITRGDPFNPLAALAALAAAVLIQVGANFANDLFDFHRGADPVTRTGPTRVTSAGLLTPAQVQTGTWLVFAGAALIGLYLVYLGGWPILLAGIASILAAAAYTAGPFPLGYNGLGDLFVFIFFGLVGVLGTYWVQVQRLPFEAVLAAVPVGALVTAILVVNNVRDVETDRAVGKRTLAVLLGRNAARAEYALLLALAYAVPLLLWLGWQFPAWVLLPALSLPLAVRLARSVATQTGPVLNRTLAGTAQLGAIFALLFAFGLIL